MVFEVKFSKLNEIDKKQFPYIWLRDFCKCKDCFDGRNKQTLINLVHELLNLSKNVIGTEILGNNLKILAN